MGTDVKFRNFSGGFGVSDDYIKLHDFLVKRGEIDFSYARLDWMITHSLLQEDNLCRIGLWEANDKIVATALFDTRLDDIFLITMPEFEGLYGEMISYAAMHMVNEKAPRFRLYINDQNLKLQDVAMQSGYTPTENKDYVARFDLTKKILDPSPIKEGFSIVSMEEEQDYKNYLYCMFRGFNHELKGETFKYSPTNTQRAKEAFERMYVTPSLRLSIKAPNGDYIAHCGMWYDPRSSFAIIEPVCTIPDYRGQGFGKAVVLEGLRKVQKLGAKYAFVGSGQQFYYAIGLSPYTQGTFWTKNK